MFIWFQENRQLSRHLGFYGYSKWLHIIYLYILIVSAIISLPFLFLSNSIAQWIIAQYVCELDRVYILILLMCLLFQAKYTICVHKIYIQVSSFSFSNIKHFALIKHKILIKWNKFIYLIYNYPCKQHGMQSSTSEIEMVYAKLYSKLDCHL